MKINNMKYLLSALGVFVSTQFCLAESLSFQPSTVHVTPQETGLMITIDDPEYGRAHCSLPVSPSSDLNWEPYAQNNYECLYLCMLELANGASETTVVNIPNGATISGGILDSECDTREWHLSYCEIDGRLCQECRTEEDQTEVKEPKNTNSRSLNF